MPPVPPAEVEASSGSLDRLFRPRSIAVVGASTRPGAIGLRVIRNLRRMGFEGDIIAVNPRYQEVEGLPCVPSVEALPPGVDSVFIAIPAEQGPDVLDAAGRHGIRSAFVNASGYADGSAAGRVLQQRLAAVARTHGIAMCGPNNMGLINVHDRIAIWTQLEMTDVRPGPVAVISHSGSIALALAQDERKLGLAYLVTAGNEAVLSAADYLDYIVRDDRVGTILLFLECIRDPAHFGAAALDANAAGKRLVVIKAGASSRARALVAAHTDSLAGDDDVYDAFFEKHAILRARDLDEMVETAVLVTSYPAPPPARHFVPVTLSGGEAAIIADVSAQVGLVLTPLSEATIERLRPAFPAFAHPDNPLDGWGLGFDSDRFGAILDALAADETIGVIGLAIDAPAAGGADTVYALAIAAHATRLAASGKHIVFFNNTAGAGPNAQVRDRLAPARIPYLAGMRPALGAIANWLHLPQGAPDADAPRMVESGPHAASALGPQLDERQLHDALAEAGVPMVSTYVVRSPEMAVQVAAALGYPVVLKGRAAHLPHKTEHGLVRLGIDSPVGVTKAYDELAASMRRLSPLDAGEIIVQPMLRDGVELIIGIRNDHAFGTLVVVGLGGIFVELVRSTAVRLAPVDVDKARDMLARTRARDLLNGFRGSGPYDIAAAADAIAAFSRFGMATQGLIESVEINPLIVLKRGVFGVDLLFRQSQCPVSASID
jgi:acetate---CoA ligase (ADP-forming)